MVLPPMSMVRLLMLAVHLLATIAKLLRPGGVRAVVAESLLLKLRWSRSKLAKTQGDVESLAEHPNLIQAYILAPDDGFKGDMFLF